MPQNPISDPGALAYYKAQISTAPDDELIAAARSLPALGEGFRPGHAKPDVVRTRLTTRLAERDGANRTRAVLSDLTLHNRVIAVLSEKALRFSEKNLARYFGPVQFYASMLLDEREALVEMAELALRRLSIGIEDSSPDLTAAIDVKRDFNPFLCSIEDWLQSPEKTLSPRPTPATSAARGTAGSLTPAQLKAMIKRDPSVKALERRAEGAEAEVKQRDTRIDELEESVKSKEQSIRALTDQLEQMNQSVKAQVDQAVSAALHTHLKRYFFDHCAANSPAVAPPIDQRDPIESAKAALSAQAAADQRYGRRSLLLARLQTARKTLEELQEAQVESLRPLPALSEAEKTLRPLITDLEDSLHVSRSSPPKPSSGYRAFLEELRRVSDLDGLVARRRVVDAAELTGGWQSSELHDAQQQLSETAMRLYLSAGGPIFGKDLRRLGSASALGLFDIAVAQAQPIRLMIDGHNVLHQLKSAWGEYFENGHPGRRAREQLARELHNLGSHTPSLLVDLWFDGPAAESYTLSDQMRVLYSGGEGEDRADRCIEAALIHLEHQHDGLGSGSVFVASADGEVAASAERYGAVVMRPSELVGLVLRMGT